MNDKKTNGFVEWIKDVVELVKDNKRIIITVLAFIVLLVTAVTVSSRIAKRSKEAVNVLDEESTEAAEEYAITDEALKKDAYPEVNNLMKKYYAAMADGDIDTIETLRSGLDDKEKIVIQKKSEYVESYPNIICYTKPGPVDKSYLAYVHYEVKLKQFEELVPGMNVWYVCADESGRYYINEDPQDDKIIEYCKIVSVQDDVQDLSNTVNVKYNEIMESNTELAKFMDELGVQMKVDVGEELAKAELPEQESAEPESESEPESEEAEPVVKTVKAITVVNVRASDSEKADKVGKAEVGQEFTLLEEKANGWSKIQYEDKEAFIKSEFLEPAATEVAEATDDNADTAADDNNDNKNKSTDNNADSTDSTKKTDSSSSSSSNSEAAKNSPSSGTGTATDTVKVREKPSTESNKLGVVYGGEKLEIVEKQSDGWTKVKYKNSVGYVKSEFLR
ncbi:MAG: SH3 domain-containing protein [Lachnospiraceae bacterium]|nr:SH3 domain-containing protein [Lachnospiraceae bacterium]